MSAIKLTQLKREIFKSTRLDIVIDDGSHKLIDQVRSIFDLFPL